ncbi:MAG: hypothetical protein PVH99_15920 [Desulfobacteraceae bacterium]|jgi:hypothetical protein
MSRKIARCTNLALIYTGTDYICLSTESFAGVLELWPDLARCEFEEQLNVWYKKVKPFEAWGSKPRPEPGSNGVMECFSSLRAAQYDLEALFFPLLQYSKTPKLRTNLL